MMTSLCCKPWQGEAAALTGAGGTQSGLLRVLPDPVWELQAVGTKIHPLLINNTRAHSPWAAKRAAKCHFSRHAMLE